MASLLYPQAVIRCPASFRSRVSSNKSRSHASAKPSDGQRHCLVSEALGKDLPPGGRESVRPGQDARLPPGSFRPVPMAVVEARTLSW